jgi:hypothetical protein
MRGGFGPVVLARAKSVESVGQENADTEAGQQLLRLRSSALSLGRHNAKDGGLEELAVNLIEDNGEHVRTPIFDRRGR